MHIILDQTMIHKTYCWVFNRCADVPGMTAFTPIYNKYGLLTVVQALVTSNEFYSKFVSTYPTGNAIDALYTKLLGRQADSSIFI